MGRVNVAVKRLEHDILDILAGVGLPAEEAKYVAASLLDAEQSGVESHGLMRLSAYIDRLEQGTAEPRPEIRVMENGAVAHVDGGNGLGQVVMSRAVDTCLTLAERYGVGIVSVCRSNHFGTAAFYSRRMAEQGYIGFAASLAGPTMAPFGGMDLLLGTNPFSIAFPGGKMNFCADMASSATAKGKIRIYAKNGKAIPLGWALDEQGNDTTDPNAALKGILLPMAGHKGYALAMAVDALCGLLSGAALSGESSSMFQGAQPANTGHFAAAIDISRFLPLEDFTQRAQDWFDRIHDSRTRPGVDRLLIPGEPEELLRAGREDCIEITMETAEMLRSYVKKYVQ